MRCTCDDTYEKMLAVRVVDRRDQVHTFFNLTYELLRERHDCVVECL